MNVVLLIGVLKEASGNKTTLRRIKNYFKHCLIRDCSSFKDENDLESFIHYNHISCIFALHAFHAGKLFTRGCEVPYCIILGGTDLSTFSLQNQCYSTMKKALENATCIIAFSEWMETECINLWPAMRTKVFFEICQAVSPKCDDDFSTTPSPAKNLSSLPSNYLTNHDTSTSVSHNVSATADEEVSRICDLNHGSKNDVSLINEINHTIPCTNLSAKLLNRSTNHSILPLSTQPQNHRSFLFTMVTGLRKEKDPLYLLDAFQRWSETRPYKVLLLIIGAQTDPEYSKVFLERVKNYPSVHYMGVLSEEQVGRVVAVSVAVVNSSLSEGMSQSILEAMQQGVAVVARDIAGNKALISHLENGLLYHTPQEFTEKAEMLLEVDGLRERLVEGGRKRLIERHSEEKEKERYLACLHFLLK